MKEQSKPNVCGASCMCVCVCVCVCLYVVFCWRDVTTGLKHFAKDKWGFYDAMFVSF